MRPSGAILKGAEKILIALAVFGYLTARQITKLLYALSSLAYVQKELKDLVDSGFALALPRRFVNMPAVYTLTGKGHTYTTALGMPQRKRVRPTEEREKARNVFFIQHTMAVTDVLISARLLSQTHPGIMLTRMYTEQELKRKIYVALPVRTEGGLTQYRTICIEPDATCEFTIQGTVQDFFHIEVYRNLPPAEWRFKQKIAGYVASLDSGQHEALFHTPALSIAVFAASEQMAETLKCWTEEALQEIERPEEGEIFFFGSVNPATASPEEMFLAPSWEQAFGTTKTPLLMLEEEDGKEQGNQ
jgi:hypothetical protein